MKTKLFFYICLIGLLICACSKNKQGDNVPDDLTGGWTIAEISGLPTINYDNSITNDPFLVLSIPTPGLGKAGVGCNTISFKVSSTGVGTLNFTNINTTDMACAPYTQSENAILNALSKTKKYAITGGELRLLDINGNLLLKAFHIGEL